MCTLLKLFVLTIVTFLVVSCQKRNNDEDNPYEFGFTIDGQQHRHEKKESNGIIQGEFGFITADGIYHVTVYATDENGDFKILSMRNVRISAPLDGSPLPPGAKIEALGQTQTKSGNQPNPGRPASAVVVSQNRPQGQDTFTTPRTPFTTQSTIKPACAGCGYVTTDKAQPFKFQSDFGNGPGRQNSGVERVAATYPGFGEDGNNFNGQMPQNPGSAQVLASYPGVGRDENNNDGRIPQNPGSGRVVAGPGSGYQNGGQFATNPSSGQGLAKNSGSGMNPVLRGISNNGGFTPGLGNSPKLDVRYDEESPGFNGINPSGGIFSSNYKNSKNFGISENLQNSPFGSNPGGSPIQNQRNQYNVHAPPGSFGQNPAPSAFQPPPISPFTDLKLNQNTIQIPNNPSIPIKDKYPGMTDGLPNGIEEKDITDLLYKFHYEVGFHGHYEKGLKDGSKIGGYFVNGRDGISRVVTYVADENGYHPKVKFVRLDADQTPNEATEKTFGLKSFEFVWYPIK